MPMPFDSPTSDARFLAWQAEKESARSRLLIRIAEVERCRLVVLLEEGMQAVANSKRRLRPTPGWSNDRS